ncbi:Alkaline phosphatase synthesis transcriptional regulatory protein PhoP [Paenibacillus plantiphilus]|uniref:Alkaline phosphatase synthesis transcriptional regulatory protein PhoP n=1 Tax=Paenibacillus plantiphilus TaxID=2905650 RepID=A0ABN8GTF8_9BACL|nr:response regulator transcription factor [Paenibacillus plantiphilus]CAH1211409.1 Alkaline phosphatase synthesis transcriptional regulatory protein PhoP [Paenibacillus plantiphilus]
MEKRILVVDDEQSIAGAIAYAFRREGYTVEIAYDGEEALRKAASFKPSVMVLDVMMPKLNGYDVCRKLDNRGAMGIIMLTVKNDIVDKIIGLELGADDYMTKPFDLRELVARVKALFRRLENRPEEGLLHVQIGAVQINIPNRTVLLEENILELTPKEFDLLALLAAHPERVYTRDELLDIVWSIDYAGGTRTVDIHMQRLRKKLGEPHQNLLQTVYGVGYKAIKELQA